MILKIIFYIFILKKLFVFVARRYCLLLFLLVLTSSTSGNPLSRGDGSESKKVSLSFTLHYTSCSLPSPCLSFRNLLDLDMVSSLIIMITIIIIIIIMITIIIVHVIIKSHWPLSSYTRGFAAFSKKDHWKMYSQIRAKATALQVELAVLHPHSPELLYWHFNSCLSNAGRGF